MTWLVEWGKTVVLHVRHAFWHNLFTYSAKWWREIFMFKVQTTARASPQQEIFYYLPLHEKLNCLSIQLPWRELRVRRQGSFNVVSRRPPRAIKFRHFTSLFRRGHQAKWKYSHVWIAGRVKLFFFIEYANLWCYVVPCEKCRVTGFANIISFMCISSRSFLFFFCDFTFRVTKDLKDRREKWDLLVKKETRVGLEHREILDPRVTG